MCRILREAELTRDHVALELARALAELEDLAVAVVALDRRVTHEADGTVVVERTLDDLRAGFSGVQLGYRGFAAVG